MIPTPSRSDRGSLSDERPAGPAVFLVVTLTVLLMAFSVAATALNEAALAATAGTAAVGLAVETGRRALRHKPHLTTPPGHGAERTPQ